MARHPADRHRVPIRGLARRRRARLLRDSRLGAHPAPAHQPTVARGPMMTTDLSHRVAPVGPAETELREAAVQRLRKKRDLQGHVLAYVMVNLLLNGIWLITMP